MISRDNIYKYSFYVVFFIVLSTLVYTANTLSISYKEALNVFVNNSLLTVLTNSSIYLFGQNDIALRLPFLLFYSLSVFLMYNLSENFFKKQSDRLISIVIFMILPGLLSTAILVNSAIIVTFFTLLYIYYYKVKNTHSYILLFLFLFIDNSFAILFLALFFYALSKKEKKLIAVSILLFALSIIIYDFDAGGRPRGFLVDTFAIYASIFSPLLFIYFFYSIYRSGIKNERTLVWYIATTSLVFSLLLSFSQQIYIEDFAPFVVIFLPYMLRIFLHTLRVRLPQFRYRHYYVLVIVLSVLFINVFLTIFNKPIYLLLDNPKKHFIYKYNFAKEIAQELKINHINKIQSDDEQLLLRLKFYGIQSGNEYFITTQKPNYFNKELTIQYFGKTLINIYVINKQ